MTSKGKFILFKIIELIILLAPIIVLTCLRWNVWFIQRNAMEVSFGAILAVIVVCFLLKGYAKKISGIIWCLICFLMTFFLKSIITDAYMIFGMALAGLVASYPFKLLYKRYYEVYKIVRNEYAKTYARKEAEKEIEERCR